MKLKNIAGNGNISLDNVCFLLKSTINTGDDGWQQKEYKERMCFCAEKAVSSSEFYRAGHEGIKLEKVLIIDSECYDNETLIRYEDEMFSVVRIYIMSDGFMELHLSLKVGNYGD